MFFYLAGLISDSTVTIGFWLAKKSSKFILNTLVQHKSNSQIILDEIKKQNIELEELKIELKLLKDPNNNFGFEII